MVLFYAELSKANLNASFAKSKSNDAMKPAKLQFQLGKGSVEIFKISGRVPGKQKVGNHCSRRAHAHVRESLTCVKFANKLGNEVEVIWQNADKQLEAWQAWHSRALSVHAFLPPAHRIKILHT